MFRKMRSLLVAAALALFAAACGGSGSSVEESATTVTSTTVTSTTASTVAAETSEDSTTTSTVPGADDEADDEDQMEDSSDSAESTTTTEAELDQEDEQDVAPAEESEAEALSTFLTGGFGIAVEPDSPIVECMLGKGMTPADFLGGGDLTQEQVAIALFTCAPDEIAAAAVADDPLDIGTEEEQVCVIAAFYRTIGEIPEDQLGEFLAADPDNAPAEVRDTSIERAIEDCGVSNEVATAIFDDAG